MTQTRLPYQDPFLRPPAVLIATLLLTMALNSPAHSDERAATGWDNGIWKSPPVPENLQREFDGHDPYGLAIGVPIRTDCSIRYRWVGNGRVYCFNSLTSKAFFMRRPEHYIGLAEAFMDSNAMPQ